MIVPFITFVIGGGLGFAAGRMAKNEQVEAELAELRQRLAVAQGKGTPLPALLPVDEYREPDATAVINLPIDREDFQQLHDAMCDCLVALRSEKAEGDTVTGAELRDCLLEAIYPDFTWPPVPGDPSSAQLMYLIADHEARKTLADPDMCRVEPPPGPVIGTFKGGAG